MSGEEPWHCPSAGKCCAIATGSAEPRIDNIQKSKTMETNSENQNPPPPSPPPPPPPDPKPARNRRAETVRVRAKRRVNIDGIHLEPKDEHTITVERALS